MLEKAHMDVKSEHDQNEAEVLSGNQENDSKTVRFERCVGDHTHITGCEKPSSKG